MEPQRLEALRPIIGTLARCRQFTYSDLEDYCYWRTPRIPIGPSTVKALRERGLLQKIGPNEYYPTSAGWRWIEEGKL